MGTDLKSVFLYPSWHAHLGTPGIHPGLETIGPQEASRNLRELANYIDYQTQPFSSDHNIQLALNMACHLVPNQGLPASIAGMSAEQKADLVVDKLRTFFAGSTAVASFF
jgi:hypothetical protein